MTAYDFDGHIDQDLMNHINAYFGVSVPCHDFPVVFDIYDNEEEFNENMFDGSDNNDLFEFWQTEGSAVIIDSFYVYFSEDNYNDVMDGIEIFP